MAIPTIDEFLESLCRMRTDALRLRDEAHASGDKKSAGTFDAQAKKIEGMILKKGGRVEA